MKRLYATTDPTEAGILQALLRDAGIESSLDNEGGAAYAVGLPTGAIPLGINVRSEDAPAAAEILANFFSKNDEDEPDPDAPAPLTAEESAHFEEKVRRGSSRMRGWLVFLYLLPGAVAAVLATAEGWKAGLLVGAVVGSLVAFAWFVNLLAEPREKENGPAPR